MASSWTAERAGIRHVVSIGDEAVHVTVCHKGGPTFAGACPFETFIAGTGYGRECRRAIERTLGDKVLLEVLNAAKLKLDEVRAKEAALPRGGPKAIESCGVCNGLTTHHADLTKGESLPAGVARLLPVRRQGETKDAGANRRCPECGSYFTYLRTTQGDPFEAPEEDDYLDRLTPAEALDRLRDYAPGEHARAATRYDAEIALLRGTMEAGTPLRTHAAKALCQHHMRRREWAEAGRLAADPRVEVRAGAAAVAGELDPGDAGAMALLPEFAALLGIDALAWEVMKGFETLEAKGLNLARAIPLVIAHGGKYWGWMLLGRWCEKLKRLAKKGGPLVPMEAHVPRLVEQLKLRDTEQSAAADGLLQALDYAGLGAQEARVVLAELLKQSAHVWERGAKLVIRLKRRAR
jgi:hypothetical protein